MIKEIKFTDNALKQIANLLSKKDDGSFFRIAIKGGEIGRAHVRTPVTSLSRMPSSA